ncbi:MAG: YdcH family protein [Polyangiaceae bacterium]|jgi:hypothetical protein|nr:YdcH family protein [Polyangiaceae bacterium]MBK8939385.1 YdcH family protein [Polyangiaceae bacterium]
MDRRRANLPNPLDQLHEAEHRHRSLDSRLIELGRRAYPTPSEQREMAELKKRKLQAKDEIARLRSMGS